MSIHLPKVPATTFILTLVLLSLACRLIAPDIEPQPAIPTPPPATLIIPTTSPTALPIEPLTPTQIQPTAEPPPTETIPEPGLPPLEQGDLASVMAWMSALLETRSAAEIDQVVGPNGALFAPTRWAPTRRATTTGRRSPLS